MFSGTHSGIYRSVEGNKRSLRTSHSNHHSLIGNRLCIRHVTSALRKQSLSGEPHTSPILGTHSIYKKHVGLWKEQMIHVSTIRMLVWKFKWWVMELKRWSTVIVYYCHWLPPIEGMLYAKHLAKYLHAQHKSIFLYNPIRQVLLSSSFADSKPEA